MCNMKKFLFMIPLAMTYVACTEKPAEDPFAVKDIKLSVDNVSLLVGEKVRITYTVDPVDATDLTVAWESLNREVATVDQAGEIVAIAPGQVNVIAMSSNGVTAVCSVVVEEQTPFNRMVGHWEGCKVEWVDNVDGRIYTEAEVEDIFWPGQDPEYYEAVIELDRARYCFNLFKDSSMTLGILCQDMDYRYIDGELKETDVVNGFHASFKLQGTRYEHMDWLYELDFKYIEEESLVRTKVHQEGERYDLIVYYRIVKENNEEE